MVAAYNFNEIQTHLEAAQRSAKNGRIENENLRDSNASLLSALRTEQQNNNSTALAEANQTISALNAALNCACEARDGAAQQVVLWKRKFEQSEAAYESASKRAMDHANARDVLEATVKGCHEVQATQARTIQRLENQIKQLLSQKLWQVHLVQPNGGRSIHSVEAPSAVAAVTRLTAENPQLVIDKFTIEVRPF